MRLSINGVYGEHIACARVWIEHRGHPVSIGSGFTAEERVRYARDPSLIVSAHCAVFLGVEGPGQGGREFEVPEGEEGLGGGEKGHLGVFSI